VAEVKFIAFWEFDVKDLDQVIQKRQARIDSSWEKRFSETFRLLFPAHLIGGGTRGFSIFEADDEARLVDFFTHYFPEVTYRIEPIFHMATVVEAYARRAGSPTAARTPR
jgi:hypothetical protein